MGWVFRGWRTVKAFFMRGRRGWAPSDTWNLDRYWAKMMGESLAHLAEHTHGWPGEGSGWESMESWQAEMRLHAGVLQAYSKDWEGKVEVGPTLHRLSEIWGHLWD